MRLLIGFPFLRQFLCLLCLISLGIYCISKDEMSFINLGLSISGPISFLNACKASASLRVAVPSPRGKSGGRERRKSWHESCYVTLRFCFYFFIYFNFVLINLLFHFPMWTKKKKIKNIYIWVWPMSAIAEKKKWVWPICAIAEKKNLKKYECGLSVPEPKKKFFLKNI